VEGDDRLVEELADAILDGDPVDWPAAESASSGLARSLVGHLKVLAAIAEVHRVTPVPAAAAASPAGETWRLPDLTPEETWGSLRLLEKLGEGSFAEVYRAWDARLDREVALKLLRRAESTPEGIASAVIAEGRMLARVRHPNVVVVHGADRIDDRVGLWMELVHGRTLEQVLRDQGPFGAAEATLVGLELSRALSAVHRAGLLHRDVKAQNVMREAGGRIVLMDFGTGRASAELDETSGHLAGTPLYLAPELLAGQPASARSDIYSLGVLLFHLVTGSFPVEGQSLREVVQKLARGERTLLRDARPDLPEKFVGVVERALARLPAERYDSAGAMEAALAAVIGAAEPTAAVRASATGLRRTAGRVFLAVAALLVAAAAGFFVARRSGSVPALPAIEGVHRLTELPGIEEFPAISPDGKSVAFTAYVGGRRQLFVRLIAGGPPLQITRDEVDHQQPRWSPDSSAILYYAPPAAGELQGNVVEISALGGAPRRLGASLGGADLSSIDGRLAWFRLAGQRIELVTAPRDGAAPEVVARLPPGDYYLYPRWSPDGRSIAYQAGDGVRFDVFVVDSAGGEPRQLTRDQTLIDGFAWLPDSRGIVFSSSRASTVPYLPTFSLWEVNLDGEALRRITSGESSFVQPDVNRAGALVAARVDMRFDLWKLPAEGEPQENVRSAVQVTRQTGHVQTPTAGPGDREVAFLSDSGGHTNLWVLETASGELRQLTYERDPEVAVGAPVWSPDGSSIAFVSSRGNPGLWFGLWLVNPDGSQLRRLVQRGLGAAWSSDGRWLYYVERADEPIQKIAAGGGEPIIVRQEKTRNVIGAHEATLYFTVERPLADGRPGFEIRAATPEGGPSRLLARIPAARVARWQIVNPALSPDGRWLVQPLTDGPTTDLWALSTADGTWRRLTDFGDRTTLIARRVSWSSDGRSVFAAVGDGEADVVLLERHAVRPTDRRHRATCRGEARYSSGGWPVKVGCRGGTQSARSGRDFHPGSTGSRPASGRYGDGSASCNLGMYRGQFGKIARALTRTTIWAPTVSASRGS
jgi:Tol biopolymer transport system component